jgi:hypothetical protein
VRIHTTLHQFIAVAVAKKITAFTTETYLASVLQAQIS